MSRGAGPRSAAAAAACTVLASLLAPTTAGAAVASPSPVPVEVRVPLAAATTAEPLEAYVMSAHPLRQARVRVLDSRGRTVSSAALSGTARGWNAAYRSVVAVDLGRVRPGSYRVRVSSGATAAQSPAFAVTTPAVAGQSIAAGETSFLALQRDGADVVPGLLHRRPSHVLDRSATVYAHPRFTEPGSDELAAPLVATGHASVDVAGGWFDAGDYLKFTETASYVLDLLQVAELDLPAEPVQGMSAESDHGMAWLRRMWQERTGTLYAQVGIGSGSQRLGLLGDHDLWRLPQADDASGTQPGDPAYFVSHRPVFAAGAPGTPISPNLAGRVAAAFALAAQREARGHPRSAAADLRRATEVLDHARTSGVRALVSTFPHAYYPEDTWTDDLELGTLETAVAARRLGFGSAGRWLRASEHWARVTMAAPDSDTLNLYDTSALAHLELAGRLGSGRGDRVLRSALLGAVRQQLAGAAARASSDPFGSAAVVSDFDAVSHELGLVATERLYARLSGDRSLDRFAGRQRDWVFGANAWGTSFVIGEGAVFPFCPQHQVANLSGSLTGGRRVAVGGVVNGPNGGDNFSDLGVPGGARACPVGGGDRFAAFDTLESTYLDDVAAWPSVEPADDFTATGILAAVAGLPARPEHVAAAPATQPPKARGRPHLE